MLLGAGRVDWFDATPGTTMSCAIDSARVWYWLGTGLVLAWYASGTQSVRGSVQTRGLELIAGLRWVCAGPAVGVHFFVDMGVCPVYGAAMTNTTSTPRLQSKPRSWQARQAVIDAIVGRQDFTTSGSLSATRVDGYAGSSGRLDGADLLAFHTDNDSRSIDYVVQSYATPIAWHTVDGRWHVVSQTFSVTTSNQQSMVRQALLA